MGIVTEKRKKENRVLNQTFSQRETVYFFAVRIRRMNVFEIGIIFVVSVFGIGSLKSVLSPNAKMTTKKQKKYPKPSKCGIENVWCGSHVNGEYALEKAK